jgi:hypothetical protein
MPLVKKHEITTEGRSPTHQLLSPTLLSFYRDDSPNNIASIPEVHNSDLLSMYIIYFYVLESTGMTGDDQEAMLDLIMEASGARTLVDDAMVILKSAKDLGLDEEILGVTRQIREAFDMLMSSITKRQKNEMDERKYTFIDRKQAEIFFGKNGQ